MARKRKIHDPEYPNCGSCPAGDSWCWMYFFNDGRCPCADCKKNRDCDIVYPEKANNYKQCEKFAKAWPDEEDD